MSSKKKSAKEQSSPKVASKKAAASEPESKHPPAKTEAKKEPPAKVAPPPPEPVKEQPPPPPEKTVTPPTPFKEEDLKPRQAEIFDLYLKESGLGLAFKIILEEILMKKIPNDQVFTYAATRLRQFEKETEGPAKTGGDDAKQKGGISPPAPAAKP